MKKIFILICPIIMLVGCFNTAEREIVEDTGFMEEPQYLDLLPVDPITCIEYNNSCYSDYDSLSCNYGIKVKILDSNWNIKHNHLHLQRLKINNDTNWWDYAVLYGKRRGDTEWEEICNKGVLPDTLDSCYYKMMDILEVIGNEIESRQYYFDEEDWTNNREHYEYLYKRKGDFIIRGECNIVNHGQGKDPALIPAIKPPTK